MKIIEQLGAHGLERRFAVYDSHSTEVILSPDIGALKYRKGDVIRVLRRCNDAWAIGQLGLDVGLFPLEHTRSDNFSISLVRGQVVPTTGTVLPGWSQAYATNEHGLFPQQNLAPLRPSPTEGQIQNTRLYYQYTPLPRGHIRLIYITPANVEEFKASGQQSVFITLRDVRLDKAPIYAAFSYCWGDPDEVSPVFCNGKLLYVPSSLWRLLSWHVPGESRSVYSQFDASRPARMGNPAVFWADAICINQGDTIEKNHQIPLMQTIYQKTSEVVAYVGESAVGMRAGICMAAIASAGQQARSSSVSARKQAQDDVRSLDWDAVTTFYSESLFRRSWIIQEIILSREITFCYGRIRILMSVLHDCALALSEGRVKPPNSILGDTYGRRLGNMDKFKESLRQILHLSRLKATWDQGGILPFVEVLQHFRSANASDPRDKVYSLLSLATEDYRSRIIPDYSASNTAVAVYEHVAQCALQLGDLTVLLPNAGISRQHSTLASWAPDWSYEPRQAINGALFSCSGPRARCDAFVPPFQHHNRSKLIIRGSIIDKISHAGPRWSPGADRELPDNATPTIGSPGPAKAPVAFYLAASFLVLATGVLRARGHGYPGGRRFSTAIWQTLTCGTIRGEQQAADSDEVHYDAFLECLEDRKSDRPVLFREVEGGCLEPVLGHDDDDVIVRLESLSMHFGLGAPPRNRGTGVGDAAGPASQPTTSTADEVHRRRTDLEERTMPFLTSLLKFHPGRRTSVTERSYFAAVPDEATVGDEIAIFFGHPLPYVVRRAGSTDDQGREQFRLVGHCYVHGIMDGELVTGETASKNGVVLSGFDAMDFALI
ncbi:heterokaryon incompatibility protein-domain-containing protein [Corynascus novoguineensis]|uniref:Heterokaryon incompatibility protein-domain-containing protein n=1 Tax=Corynascus novoguineensis TaxID=1126955 RepID=A0AAN7CL93_9PEZI|nr:heterokaryon incompatibility protein-domain-containing protein [Corynascus novoguineensis]